MKKTIVGPDLLARVKMQIMSAKPPLHARMASMRRARASTQLKILVIGGSQFMGRTLVDTLLNEQCEETLPHP